jgi:hypothetical protein
MQLISAGWQIIAPVTGGAQSRIPRPPSENFKLAEVPVDDPFDVRLAFGMRHYQKARKMRETHKPEAFALARKQFYITPTARVSFHRWNSSEVGDALRDRSRHRDDETGSRRLKQVTPEFFSKSNSSCHIGKRRRVWCSEGDKVTCENVLGANV